jgi:selenide,water dikinase
MKALAASASASIHLVLAGGGHTHVHVLRALAMRRLSGVRISIVSPFPHATYSGMVPGVVAGRYRIDEAQIDVRALAAHAGAAFLCDGVVRIDASQRWLELRERPPLRYDLLSLDIGSRPAAAERAVGGAAVTMVKPIEVAAAEIEAALATPPPPDGREVVIVGAGPGGVELAFAVAARLRREGSGHVTLCDAGDRPIASRHPRTSARASQVLARHGIQFLGGTEVTAVMGGEVHLADGRRLQATLVVWATGAAGPALFAASGLPIDARGFLRVGDDLRCQEFPEIFAAGDCATLASYPELPKAGVYAVREGPILTHNLRAAALGRRRLRKYRPQSEFLSILNTADGRAILSWRSLSWYGRSAWWLKDWIDRRFIAKYARAAARRPGGCV